MSKKYIIYQDPSTSRTYSKQYLSAFHLYSDGPSFAWSSERKFAIIFEYDLIRILIPWLIDNFGSAVVSEVQF